MGEDCKKERKRRVCSFAKTVLLRVKKLAHVFKVIILSRLGVVKCVTATASVLIAIVTN